MTTCFVRITAGLVPLVVLTACVRPPIKHTPKLATLSPHTAHYQETVEGLAVRMHKLDSAQVKQLLGEPLSNLSVLHLSIVNKGMMPWEYTKDLVDLPLVSNENVAQILSRGRFVFTLATLGLGLCGVTVGVGLLLTGFSLLPGMFVTLSSPMALSTGLAVLLGTVGGEVAIVREGEKSYVAACLALEHLAPATVRIDPGMTKSMLLFVPRGTLPEVFEVSLRNLIQPHELETFEVIL